MYEYLRRILKAQQSGTFNFPGLYYTEIEHDKWCSYNKGRECDCNPVITVIRTKGASMTIDADGKTTPIRESKNA
jgi:hypothetical protein